MKLNKGKNMNLYTNTEAKACTMIRCDKITENDIITWVVGVNDNNRIYYEVILEDLGDSPSKSVIQSATISALEKIEKKLPNENSISIGSIDDDFGIGSKLN